MILSELPKESRRFDEVRGCLTGQDLTANEKGHSTVSQKPLIVCKKVCIFHNSLIYSLICAPYGTKVEPFAG